MNKIKLFIKHLINSYKYSYELHVLKMLESNEIINTYDMGISGELNEEQVNKHLLFLKEHFKERRLYFLNK